MKKMNQNKLYHIYITLFFALNILNTYFLTVSELNRYIAPFRHTFFGEVNAFFGNFSILLIVILCLFSFIRTARKRMITLLVVTFLLNTLIFALSIFNLYFGTAFSAATFIIFKNPASGFASGIFIESMLELILYYRILIYIPFFTLLTVFILSDRKIMKYMLFSFSLKRYMIGFFSTVLILLISVFSYGKSFRQTLPLSSVNSTYAIQNLGVYPYYFGQLIGYRFEINVRDLLDIKSDQKLATAYHEYNKNQMTYTNFFNQKSYSNILTESQILDDLFVHPSLKNNDTFHGILEDKNLVLVHLESFNYFLMEIEAINDRLVFLNQLLSESFVFSEFYTNVGMGVSSDAELSVLTGLIPTGDRTLFWEFDNKPYELHSLVNYFNLKNYYTKAIHGDTEIFYNRRNVYQDLMFFDAFLSLEDFVESGYVIEEGYLYDTQNQLIHHSPWISDYHLADLVNSIGKTYISQQTPFMMFPVTMMPHTPFDFDPYGSFRTDVFPQWADDISRLTLKYINYIDYYDESIKRFFINEFDENTTLDNTVYVFYSDHGSGIKNGDLDILFDYELDDMETRRKLQHTLAFIYVPGEVDVQYGDYVIKEGLLKGNQTRVRSQIDLYRTIVELFNLPADNHTYFGVHGLSHEPTFALDNRLMDVVLDDYFFSMRNKRKFYPNTQKIDDQTYQYILRYKLLSDLMLSKATFQSMVDEAIATYYP